MVLEWHPENSDPWRIQRRLLVEIMMPGIDPPVSPRQPNGPDYWYFPPTGHAVSNHAPDGSYTGFKWFFDRYGREDTFGYPMEEPKRRRGQDGVERWTQRFQAALFEYHPEHDIPGIKPGTNIPWRKKSFNFSAKSPKFCYSLKRCPYSGERTGSGMYVTAAKQTTIQGGP